MIKPLIAECSMVLEEQVLFKFPAIERTKNTIYNQRTKEPPPLDLKSLHFIATNSKEDKEELSMVVADTDAKNGDRRIIEFAKQLHLDYSEEGESLICHGMSDIVPLLTYQLYTIHCLVGNIAPPLLICVA